MSEASCEGRRGIADGASPRTCRPASAYCAARLPPPGTGAHTMNVRLYLLQRATAAIMVPLVLAHLAVIYYATRGGLSAAEILARTRGSIGWGAFYGLFVLA